MVDLQIDNKTTKQIRIDKGLHTLLKLMATKKGMSIKTLLEGYLADILGVKKDDN